MMMLTTELSNGSGASPESIVSWAVDLTGTLDPAVLGEALHETLHSRLTQPPAPSHTDDLSHLPPAERADAVDSSWRQITTALARDSGQPPARAALYRLAAEHHVLCLAFKATTTGASAAACDAVLEELGQRYRGGCEAPTASVGSKPFAGTAWLPNGTDGNAVRPDEDTPVRAEELRLPVDHFGSQDGTFWGSVDAMSRTLPPELSHLLRDCATRLEVSAAHLVQAAFAAWLHRHSGQCELVFGVRPQDGDAAAGTPAGAPPIPIRVEVDPSAEWRTLVEQCRDAAEAWSGQRSPEFGGAPTAPGAMRACVAAVSRPAGELAAGVSIRTRIPAHPGPEVDLALALDLVPGAGPAQGYEDRLAVSYHEALFSRTSVVRLVERFEQLLGQALSAPVTPVGDLGILLPAERALINRVSTGAVCDFAPATVPERFREQARRWPDRLAVTDDRGGELTYAELDRRSDALAAHIAGLGAGRETHCAVLHHRCVDTVVALLAVLKAGGAYIPVDPDMPAQRMAAVLKDADVELVLTDTGLADRLPAGGPRAVLLDQLPAQPPGAGSLLPGSGLSPDNLAYVIYTSGSTGSPKGVLVDHRALTHFVDMVQEFFQMSYEDRIAQCAALWFDVSVFEIFAALLTGASTHIAGDQTKLTPLALHTLLRDRRVTALMTTPTLLETLDPDDLPDLRVMSVGGEPFSGALTNRWSPGRRFVNGYGPAEATVEVVAKICEGDWRTAPPIGTPLANHCAYALDERMRQVPVGVTGELYVGGPGLARGYLARPGLTGGVFVPDPFGSVPGRRLYRTGDLVRLLPDGDMLYVGRTDRQVKVRGMRVELGEVEQTLSRHPGVRRAAVVAASDQADEVRLIGYVMVDPDVTADDVRASAAAWLPAYMVPAQVVLVESIPVTTSGKVDLAALTAPPTASAPTAETSPAESLTTTQQAVAEIVQEVLGLDSASLDEDLFALGGNSLQVLRVLSQVRSVFSVLLTPQEFFEDPTIGGIASAIDSQLAHA